MTTIIGFIILLYNHNTACRRLQITKIIYWYFIRTDTYLSNLVLKLKIFKFTLFLKHLKIYNTAKCYPQFVHKI